MIGWVLHHQLEHRKAMLVVVLGASIWGLLWLPLRQLENWGLHGIWPTVLFLGLPILPYALVIRRLLLAERENWRFYLVGGSFIGAGFAFYTSGLVLGSIIKTTLLFYLTPVWATLFGMVILGERSGPMRWFAIFVGLIGCILIMDFRPTAFVFQNTDWFGLLSGLSWSLGSVLIRRYPAASGVMLTFIQYVAGCSIALLIIAIYDPVLPLAVDWVPVLLLGGLTAAVFLPTILIILRINQYMSPGLIGLLMLSELVVAVVSAWLLLGELLLPLQWLGAMLIMLTAVLVATMPMMHVDAAGVMKDD